MGEGEGGNGQKDRKIKKEMGRLKK